jgi:hypothetical protein
VSEAGVKCGGCEDVLAHGEAEMCWWCKAPLCAPCWDRFGHCGHPEAEAENERARRCAPAGVSEAAP